MECYTCGSSVVGYGKSKICKDGVRDGALDLVELSVAVENYKHFTEDNDPLSEHDFGSLMFENKKIFWKIDYYNMELKLWCDLDSSNCSCVLTLVE